MAFRKQHNAHAPTCARRFVYVGNTSLTRTAFSPKMDIRQPKQGKRGCYRPYDPEQISRAVKAVHMGKISVRKAAQQFNIPKSTLIDRVSGRTDIDCVRSGVTPLFTEGQEELLKNHLVTMAEVGYGYSRQETINLASDYAFHLGLRDFDHPLTGKWLQGFLHRFPELKVKKPRSLEIARACSATRPAIDNYFKELDRIMTKYNLHDRPHSVLNIDEKGLSLEHKPPRIIAGKQYKAQAVTAGRSKTVTLIGCVSGVGQLIPPFFVFPGARMINELMEDASPGAVGTVTQSGWSNTLVFEDYMKNHLIKFLPSRSPESPVLVLYDGHKSHVSLSLIEWAKTEHIILFVLPPHCSHLLQPLDVSCFGPFEISWNSACHRYIRESGGQMVTRKEACKIACKVYSTTLTVQNIQAAFRRSGLIPFNPEIIQDHQIAPSLSFAKPSVSSSTTNIEQTTVDAEKFLEEKGGKILENVTVAKKPRNTLSKVVAGKAITEDEVISKIKEHTYKYKPKTKQTVNKSVSPKPSTSGISKTNPSKKPRKLLVAEEAITDSSDEEIPDSEKCIVCKRVEPDTSSKPYLFIINWGRCDKCNGWVHLSFCSSIRVLRRGDPFLCPKCSNS